MEKINCILLIDDDLAGNAFHTITITQSNTCNAVRTASNGCKALEYMTHANEQPAAFPPPDLIFLDINMPKMNGFEFLDAYKKMSLKPGIKPIIIMLSTSSNPEDINRAKSYSEISEFQNKPLTIESVKLITQKYFPETKVSETQRSS